MDARTYLDTYGESGIQALLAAVAANGGRCTLGYFKQIAYGYRKPSSNLAMLLVESDPHRKLELIPLLRARKQTPIIHRATDAQSAGKLPPTVRDALDGLEGFLRPEERTALILAFERGPRDAVRLIEHLDVALDVRARLLAAAEAAEQGAA